MQSHQMKRAVAGASAPTDPNFKQTVLLLHGDGTNGGQNNTFIDSSTNNFTITRNGNTTQGTFSPFSQPDGYWSNYFDGTGDYLTVADNSALQMGSGDFTIEFFVNYSSISGYQIFYDKGYWDTGALLIQTGNGNGRLIVYVSGAAAISETGTATTSTWIHYALVRTGSTITLYRDGVSSGSATYATNFNSTSTLGIGCNPVASGGSFFPVNGYLSNFRLVKGTAVYTGAFTPPTAPLTAITNTSLLTCQSNRFKDNSSNAFTITRNGDAAVTAFSPFAPTAAYSASINGGSGYFDGSNDSLSCTQTAFSLGTSDFTIEFWFFRPVSVTTNQITVQYGGTYGVYIAYNGSGLYATTTNGVWDLFSDTALSLISNSWNHIALCRNGTTISCFTNGARSAKAITSSAIYQQNNNIEIGSASSIGHISDFRVVIGSYVYDATQTSITVPTAPLTAITNTQFLCNFTNAAIFDNTGKNDLETVGNAQISTSVVKYGTGSMYFDGTGDWLLIKDNADLKMGTVNFTIEFWVYLASGDIGSNRGLVAKGGASTGWLISLNTTEKVVFTYTASTITSTGSITTNAWNHIAVVRGGTGSNQTKIYINGSNDGTGTVSTDFTQTESMYVGADRSAANPMKGYIDDLRITKGVARYTANFTVPTRAFPDK